MAINNSNQIVGYSQDMSTPPYSIRAVELINGTLTDLDPSNATAYDSEAVAINNAGEFVVNSNEAICTRRLPPPSFKTISYVCGGELVSPGVQRQHRPDTPSAGSLWSHGHRYRLLGRCRRRKPNLNGRLTWLYQPLRSHVRP